MALIKTLSPVHVSTGNSIEEPSYYIEGNKAYRFEFSKLLSNVPYDVYLDKNLLNILRKEKQDKKLFYKRIVKYFNYNKGDALYTLTYQLDYDIKEYTYGVSEQIKTLDKPYIPGSSVKGALVTAWVYYMLKINYSIVEKKLHAYLTERKKGHPIELLIGNELKDFMKDLGSILMCKDVHFEKYEFFEANRIGSGKDFDGTMPLRYEECIQENQSVQTSLFKIDSYKYQQLQKKYENNKNALILLKMFNMAIILKAVNEYTYDALIEESSGNNKILYSEYPDILKQIESIKKIIKDHNSEKMNVVLRIGNSTNYFFKTISLLIKTKSPDLYYKYFDMSFSPSTKGPTKAKATALPKTKVVLTNGQKDYLAGFILLSYDKKS